MQTNSDGKGPTIMEIYAKLIRDVGFPITVAGVLLWFLVARLDPAIGRLADTIQATTTELRIVMQKQVEQFTEANKIGQENNIRLRQLMGDERWNAGRRALTRPNDPSVANDDAR